MQQKKRQKCASSSSKDTTDALRRFGGIQLDQEALIVTCAVEALYTSIQHEDGLEATRFFLSMTDNTPEFDHTWDVWCFIHLHSPYFCMVVCPGCQEHKENIHADNLMQGIPRL
ncbi:uncharacterized protein LOC130358228 isoform X3 [Hyla sarda]|uniref:uncharacterized protein LOC130358228 isoform X3 n=1 Tax=Hyla sarda TaxID=327740 RepID=UPI0024C44491|nr:uncharacterized protein LOC130358228 isoform X3 [Hyla sarda]